MWLGWVLMAVGGLIHGFGIGMIEGRIKSGWALVIIGMFGALYGMALVASNWR